MFANFFRWDGVPPALDLLLWAQQKNNAPAGAIPPWVLFAALGVAFYLIMIRPQRRDAANMEQMLKNLKQNDKVVTIGGIHGTVVTAPKDGDTVVIRIDENCKMRMTRSAIARIIEPKDKKAESK